MNELVVQEYIDKRDGKKRLFDQYGQEYESLSGLGGLFDFLKPKDNGGSGFGNFLQKTGNAIVGVFKKKDDGTLARVDHSQGLPPMASIAPDGSKVYINQPSQNNGSGFMTTLKNAGGAIADMFTGGNSNQNMAYNPNGYPVGYNSPYPVTSQAGFLGNNTLLIGGAILAAGLVYALSKK